MLENRRERFTENPLFREGTAKRGEIPFFEQDAQPRRGDFPQRRGDVPQRHGDFPRDKERHRTRENDRDYYRDEHRNGAVNGDRNERVNQQRGYPAHGREFQQRGKGFPPPKNTFLDKSFPPTNNGKGRGYPEPDRGFPMMDQRYPIPDDRFPMSEGRFPMHNGGVPMPNGGIPMPNQGYPIPGQRYPIPDGRPPMPEGRFPMPAREYPMQDEDFLIRQMDHLQPLRTPEIDTAGVLEYLQNQNGGRDRIESVQEININDPRYEEYLSKVDGLTMPGPRHKRDRPMREADTAGYYLDRPMKEAGISDYHRDQPIKRRDTAAPIREADSRRKRLSEPPSNAFHHIPRADARAGSREYRKAHQKRSQSQAEPQDLYEPREDY